MSCLSLETKAKIIMCTTTQERERGMKGEGEGGGERDIVTRIERQFPNELV